MQSITIKNIPDDIHQSLKKIAKINHRSLNNEVIYCLEKYLKISQIDTSSVLKKAHMVRSKIQHQFSDLEIQKAKIEGRK